MTMSLQRYRATILKNGEALTRIVANANFKVPPALYPDVFRDWARQTAKRKIGNDPEFSELVQIRELRRKHLAEIQVTEDKYLQAKDQYANTSAFNELDRLDKDIEGAKKAIANIQKFIENASTGSPSQLNVTALQGEPTDDSIKPTDKVQALSLLDGETLALVGNVPSGSGDTNSSAIVTQQQVQQQVQQVQQQQVQQQQVQVQQQVQQQVFNPVGMVGIGYEELG